MPMLVILLALLFPSWAFGWPEDADPATEWSRKSGCTQHDNIVALQRPVWFSKRDTNTLIVFVHGIFSNNRDGWLADNCAYFPGMVAKSFTDVGVFLGGFYTGALAGDYDAVAAAELLYDRLSGFDSGDDRRPLDRHQIIFVAHSTGGLIVRYMLAAHQHAFATKKIGLVLLASPTKGSAWANLGKPIASLGANTLAQQLTTDSEFLRSLDSSFQTYFNSRKDSNPIVGIEVVEQKSITPGLAWGYNWTVVDRDSAGVYFRPPKLKAGANHFEVAKPTDEKDDTFFWLSSHYDAHFKSGAKSLAYQAGKSARLQGSYTQTTNKTITVGLPSIELTLPAPAHCSLGAQESDLTTCTLSWTKQQTDDGYAIIKTLASIETVGATRPVDLSTKVSSEGQKSEATVSFRLRNAQETFRFSLMRTVEVLVAKHESEVRLPATEYAVGDPINVTLPYDALRPRLQGTVLGVAVDVPFGANEESGWLKWSGDERRQDSYVAKWILKRPY